ncbi:MAG TPA: Holliday junction branch migration protein RuvA [Chitinophagaceae bacterium]|nr:Holliday junction branch migration protein RuvA [Chitinophagaceae bacterium]
MIAYIEGKITYKSPTCIYLDINGLGYEVQISLHTYEQIQSLETCKLHTHLHIKEDAHTLYGFYTKDEKEMFLSLISVSGVGAATTRVILSGMKPEEIQAAILDENVKMLKSVKGIGVKTAKRIILDLKDKLTKNTIVSTDSQYSVISSNNNISNDALEALVALGISKNMASKAIKRALKANAGIDNVELLIKQALKNI